MDGLDKQLLGRRGGGNPEAPADGRTDRETDGGQGQIGRVSAPRGHFSGEERLKLISRRVQAVRALQEGRKWLRSLPG